MFFQNLARKNEIGANCYLLETSDSKVVLDSGMHPKEEGLDALPAHHELAPHSVDAIVLSHSHLDHTQAPSLCWCVTNKTPHSSSPKPPQI